MNFYFSKIDLNCIRLSTNARKHMMMTRIFFNKRKQQQQIYWDSDSDSTYLLRSIVSTVWFVHCTLICRITFGCPFRRSFINKNELEYLFLNSRHFPTPCISLHSIVVKIICYHLISPFLSNLFNWTRSIEISTISVPQVTFVIWKAHFL